MDRFFNDGIWLAFVRQATNKIAGISEETAAFLRTYF
jgi:hypothetical protein